MRKMISFLITGIIAATANIRRDLARLDLLTNGISGGAGSTDWVPSKDADLDAFAQNFDALVTASPGTYGLDAGIAAAFHTQALAFTTALATSTNPATSTTVTVAAKDAQKALLVTLLRQDAAIVQATPSVGNDDKIALGLTVRTNTPAPIPAPATFPLLDVISAGPLTHTLRYADSDTPDSSKKPDGAVGMELHIEVSATPITDPTQVGYYGLATRNPFVAQYQSADKGKQAYICGRWITAKGDVGPWSSVQDFTVAA